MNTTSVTQQEMQRVYDEMKTPIKRGMILREEGVNIDCANVFRMDADTFGMVFARHEPADKERSGYETWLATSKNLLDWDIQGRVLAQKASGWDCLQADGGMCLINPRWEGDLTVEKFDGRYWMTYLGNNLPGYEPDPLQIGLASSPTLTPGTWQQMPEPILRQDDPDAREFEHRTLYKSCVIRDPDRQLGHPFVMYYNAKSGPFGIERIGIAVSDNMREWKRYGAAHVLDQGIEDRWNISGDPQLVRFEDLWVMHYFVARDGGAYDSFACSRDLVHWDKWEGQPLIQPSESYDARFAHKPFVIKHDGVVYHYYCAVGDQGRGLAVATSR